MGVSRDTEEPSRLPTREPRPLSRWAGEGQQPPAPRARLAARRQRLCSLTTHGLAACPQGLAASCCPGPAGRRHEVGHRSAVPSWCLSCMGLGDGARAGGTRGLGLQLPPTLCGRGEVLCLPAAVSSPVEWGRSLMLSWGQALGRGLPRDGSGAQWGEGWVGVWVTRGSVARPGPLGALGWPRFRCPGAGRCKLLILAPLGRAGQPRGWPPPSGSPSPPHVQATRGQPRTRHSRAPRRGDGEAMARVPQPIPGPGQLPSLAAEGTVCSQAHASQPGYGVPPSRQAGTRLRDRCALTPQRGPGTQPSGS